MIPPDYLSKVLQALRRGGIIKATRGAGGGIVLTRAPAAITVLEVINAVDPITRICKCPLGIPSHGTSLCALHKKLDDAIADLTHRLRELKPGPPVQPSTSCWPTRPTRWGRRS